MGYEAGPKQYRLLGEKSVLQHTIDCFSGHCDVHDIQVVVHKDDIDLYEASVTKNAKLLPPVKGGNTRQLSCNAGMEAVAEIGCSHVLIHDAARPFVSHELITRTIKGIDCGQGALPACPIADTIKKLKNGNLSTVPREGMYTAQTPQGFILSEILSAHQSAVNDNLHDFTDDAAVAEWAGISINLVEGDRDNFKITDTNDFNLAERRIALLQTIQDIRTGSGYDVHALVPGISVVLCGVDIPHDKQLSGHSDADVGLHALTDALLGTIGAGDIGSHFPPSDDKWKDAPSDHFLTHACNLVFDAGGVITNLDVTVICEAPRIGPHRESMRQRIAEICDIEMQRVSVKATTNERIGFIGREEGIAALATATVSFPVSQRQIQ